MTSPLSETRMACDALDAADAAAPDSPDRVGRARDAALAAFVAEAGWGRAARAPLAGDASTRRYERLSLDGGTAVLMDAPPRAEAASCPPEADHEERRRMGYNASARLAGPNAAAFAGLAQALTARGFSAPQVHAADAERGFLLLEDLGDALYSRAISDGASEGALYEAAIDTLAAVARATLPEDVKAGGRGWRIQRYDTLALQTEADLLPQWYAPHRGGVTLDDAALEAWRAAWSAPFAWLEAQTPTLTLRDVHADNLIWLPDRDGHARAGLLDFQDALFGHGAYDVVSLLEDARRDVDADLAAQLMDRYVENACVADEPAFCTAYAILGAQRSAKILGIFVRLTHRDGRSGYLERLPRTARHFLRGLEHPELAGVKAWVSEHAPGLQDEAQG